MTDWGHYWIIHEDERGVVHSTHGLGFSDSYHSRLKIRSEYPKRLLFSWFGTPKFDDETLTKQRLSLDDLLMDERRAFEGKPFIEVEETVKSFIDKLRSSKEKYFL